MSDAPNELIEEIFHEALDRAPEERDAFLRERCASDADLLARVRDLVAHDDAAGELFLGGGSENATSVGASEPRDGEADVPRVLGRFTIVRRIGEGGMGCVYEARQENPRRSVALKVLRSDCASRGVIRRFELEAQALGQLQHSGIAQVYEAGTFASPGSNGVHRPQPFLAMELIRGVPLDVFVRERRLPVPEILRVVAKIADALHHAHLRGVIHRDVKPGNILVDEAGEPKVLDFGIARLTRTEVDNVTTATQAGQLIGTLPYMSPEQVLGEHDAVDARTDVYSLGVVMYEILADRLPLDVRGRSVPEAARVIREDDPSRLGLLDTLLRGDVETIVARAMEKDRTRRYQTAAELAADIRRFLTHEPVLARPPSSLYHLRKFARRNKALVGGVAVALAATTIGCIGMAYLAHRESLQRVRAEDNAHTSRLLAYRSSINAAQSALEAQDAALAREHLDAAPVELRAWEWRHLDWIISRFDRTFTHPAGATCAVPAPDGSRIFIGGKDGSVCAFDGRTGALLARWKASQQSLKAIVLGLGGARLVITDSNGVAGLDGHDGHQLWRLESTGAAVDTEGTAPDGSVVAVRIPSSFGVEIRDLETGALRKVIPIDEPSAMAARFSPDGRRIAISVLQTLELRDFDGGATLWSAPGRWCHGFSPDGARLAVSLPGENKGIQIIDVATGAPLPRESFAEVRSISLSDGLGFDVSCDSDGGLSVRDPLSGRVLARAPSEGLSPVIFDGGTRVLSSSGANEVRVWSLATLVAPLDVMASFLSIACVISGNARCAVSQQWENLRGWDLDTGCQLWSRRFSRRIIPEPSISDDGTRVGADLGGELHILDGSTGATLQVVTLPAEAQRQPCVWSPDGKTVFRGGSDGALRAIDADSGGIRASPRFGDASVTPLACTRAGDMVLLAIGEREIALVSATDGSAVWRVKDRNAQATCAAFARQGSLLAVGDQAGSAELRDAGTGELRGRLGKEPDPLQTVSFHPVDARLATASDNGIAIHDVNEAAEVFRLRLFRGVDFGTLPSRAVFTEDGKRLCAARGRFRSFETESDPERFARRLRACEAEVVVQATTWPLAVASDVCAAIEARTDLSPQRRADALACVRARGDLLNTLNSEVWEAVLKGDDTPETYRHALRASQCVCEAMPNDWALLNTLGLAQFRVGAYDAAIETMRRCDEMHRAAHQGESFPLDLVVLAMAFQGSGRADEARATRAAALDLLRGPARTSATDAEARMLLAEFERRWPAVNEAKGDG